MKGEFKVEYKILGIAGSPVKKGNVESYLEQMVETVKDDNFTSEIVRLSEVEINECLHCNFCLTKQKPGKYCSINDGAQSIYEKVEQADIIILASPVYFMRMSAKMAAFIDRLRVFVFGNLVKGRLKNKIGVSVAVSWLRHGGVETTHLSHLYAFMTLEMIPVGVHRGVSPLGASAVASRNGTGFFDESIRWGVKEDVSGREAARYVMARAVELLKMIKRLP